MLLGDDFGEHAHIQLQHQPVTLQCAHGRINHSAPVGNPGLAFKAGNLLGPGDADRIQHRFRLHGQDPDWVDTGPVALRTFARLPVGTPDRRFVLVGGREDPSRPK